jgi:hypothetical protein
MASNLPGPVVYPRGDAALWSAPLDLAELAAHSRVCGAATRRTKGALLEQMLGWLIPHLPGVRAMASRTFSTDGASEVDLDFANQELPRGLGGFGPGLLAECKNLDTRVDSRDVAWFDWKMRIGHVSTGIMFAARGITGNPDRRSAAWSIIQQAAIEGRSILVFRLDEFAAVQDRDGLRALFEKKASLLRLRDYGRMFDA